MGNQNNLNNLVKATGLIFIGLLFGSGFDFLSRIAIARFTSQELYGIFSLGIAIFGISAMFSDLGLNETISRQIPYFLKKKQKGKAKSAINSAIRASSVTSILIGTIGFLAAGRISALFGEPELTAVIRIVSIALPFWVMTGTISAIFRGLGRPGPRATVLDFQINFLKFGFTAVAIYLGYSFMGIITAYSSAFIVGGLTMILLAIIRLPKGIVNLTGSTSYGPLLAFSLPLLGQTFLFNLLVWSDTLILGLLKTATDVGAYNSAVITSKMLLLILVAAMFLYIPISSTLFAGNKKNEVKQLYRTISKWLLIISLPIMSTVILFPDAAIQTFFGSDYLIASTPLMILIVGYSANVLIGPSLQTLISSGNPSKVFIIYLSGFITNIVLNWILIPIYGIAGAAIATSFSFWLINIVGVIVCNKLTGANPFNMSYFKSLLSGILLFIVSFLVIPNRGNNIIGLILFGFIYTLIFGIFLLALKVFSSEDKELLNNLKGNALTKLRLS